MSKFVKLFAKIYDMPLTEEEVENIVHFQLNGAKV